MVYSLDRRLIVHQSIERARPDTTYQLLESIAATFGLNLMSIAATCGFVWYLQMEVLLVHPSVGQKCIPYRCDFTESLASTCGTLLEGGFIPLRGLRCQCSQIISRMLLVKQNLFDTTSVSNKQLPPLIVPPDVVYSMSSNKHSADRWQHSAHRLLGQRNVRITRLIVLIATSVLP